jgi:lysophosphatidate acyltransferase
MKHWPGGNCSPLAKKEIFYAWPFGIGVWLAGITFIDRLNPDKAHGTIRELSERINNEQVCFTVHHI